MPTLTSTMIVRLLDKVSGPAKGVASALTGIGKAANGVNGSLSDRLGAAIASNNARLDQARGAMVDAVAGVYALKSAYAGTIGTAIKFESAIADVGKVSGFDDAGLAKFAKDLRGIAANEIPMAVEELAALSAEAAAAGIGDADLVDFTRMAAKAGVAWGMTGAAAGENLAKLKSALGLSIEETRLFGDAINHVSDALAANSPELLDFSRRVAAQGEFFGFSKEQTLAFGGAMISAGFQADVAATSFKNMGRALTKGGSATDRQAGAFKKLGMDARKVAKAMQKDSVGTTLKVIDALNKVPEHMKASVMSDLFGDEAAALIPLIGNTKALRDALALTAEEQNYANSVGKEFAKRAQTSEFQVQRFKNRLTELGLAVGGTLLPALNDTLAKIGPLALKMAEFAEANPKLVDAAVKAGVGIMGLRIAMLATRFAALQTRGAILSLASPIVSLGTWAATAATQQIALQRALASMSGAKLTGFQTAAQGLRGIAMAVPGVALLGSAASGIGATVAALTAPAWLGIAAGVAAVAGAGALVYRYWDRIAAVVSGVGRALGEQLAPVLDTVRPALDRLAPIGNAIASGWNAATDALTNFGTWVSSFFSREVLTEQQAAQWETAGYDMATRLVESVKAKVGELVDWFTGLPGRIMAAIGSIDIGSLIKWPTMPSWLGGGGASAAPANDNAAAPAVDGQRARGGPVRRSGLYLVGEEGPELFTPDAAGSITPTDETMGLLRSAGDRAASGGGERRASAPAGGGVQIASVVIHVNGSADPAETARQTRRQFEEHLRFELRGAHSDS